MKRKPKRARYHINPSLIFGGRTKARPPHIDPEAWQRLHDAEDQSVEWLASSKIPEWNPPAAVAE